MLMSIGIIRGFKSTIKEKLNGFSGEVQITAYQPNSLEKNYFIRRDNKIESLIESTPGLESYFTYASKVALIKLSNRVEPVVLKGVSDISKYNFLIQSIYDGSRINSANEIIVSKILAEKLHLKLNQSALFYFADEQIKIRKLKIVAFYETGIEELDRNTVISDLNLIRSVNDWTDNQTGAYQVSINENTNAEFVTEKLNEILPIDQKAISNKELFPSLYDWVELLSLIHI